jgi:hypothetical protein
MARIHQDARVGVGLGHGRHVQGFARRGDDHLHGQVVFFRELEVALVVGRHGHDRARAVAHEHEVGHVDGHPRPGEGVYAEGPAEHALLFQVVGGAHDAVHVAHLVHEGQDLFLFRGVLDQFGHQRMLGGQAHERGPEHRVLAGGEHRDRGCAGGRGPLQGKIDLGPDAFADPVALHGQDAFGPAAFQLFEVVQEFVA